MNSTTTRITEGSRVLYIGGGDEHYEPLVGKFGTVTSTDNSSLPYYVRFDNDNTWWCPVEAVIHVPKIGDKVIPVNGDKVGIPAEYRNAVGTVSGVFLDITGNRPRIDAEFQSRQKPDDTICWSMNEWKPADGHTLTVSDPYRATVGDKVLVTGCLDDSGIITGLNFTGTVTEVADNVWVVLSDSGDRFVSGPGYVTLVVDTDIVEPVRPHEEPRIITELREEAATLKRELDRANERVEEFRTRASKWERDFMRYAERIMEEANDRDWCSEYDRIMQEISENLEIATIPERESEVDIEWDETYTVTVRRSGTVTLRAGYDESDIEDAARRLNGDSDADRSDVIEAVRNGNYESESYVDDSAQEA